MSCFENFIPKTEVEKDLVKTYSTNTRKRDKLLGILKSEEFREYYRAKEGKDLDENVDKAKVKALLSNMFNSKYFSVEETSVIKTSKGRFTSFSARKLAKDESIRSMHVLYYKGATAKANDGKIHKFKNYAEFCKFIGKRWEQLALDRVIKICDVIAVDGVLPSNIQQILNSTDTSSLKSQRNSKIKELNATKDKAKAKNLKSEIIALDEEIDKLIYKRLDGILNRADASDSDRNIFAAYSETKMEYVNGKPVVNSNNAFFSDIKRNGSVKHIVNLSGKGDFTYDYEIDEEQNNNESADGDDFIAKANQHLGNFDSYAQHADSIIRSYLSSLVKLTDANNLESYDTDNELGIMMPMNVGQVMSVLYSRVDKSSPDNMISSIERIAKDDKEMRGLAKLAKDMKDDANLKAAIYSTFGKIVIPKGKISVDANGHTYAISNPRAMRKDALRMSCLNEIRSTVLNVDPEMLKHVIDKLKDSKDVNYITVELINVCKHISPNLAKNAINLYINKDNDKLKNAKQLMFILQALVTNMPKTQALYYSIRNKQKELRDQNYKIKKDIREVEKFTAIHGWTKAADDEIKSLYLSIQYNNRVINSLYKEDYIKELIPNIYSLCDTLLDYTSVAVELNSINVEGNSSSDVINSSMITSIINRLQNVAARQAFGDSNARYSGFKFSNILIEKTKDGVLVNPGLFRIVDSDIEGNEIQPKVVPTEYCRDIINFALFDGVKNGFTNEAALYERLSSDDYLISAFDAFNSRKEIKVNGRSILMANYFCRIPSDAPKQFLCEAPRLNTKGLIDRNGNINRNHPIFDNFRNIFHGEINDAVQSLGRIFKIDAERHAVAIEHGEPVFREGYSNNPEDARKAYDVFHVGTNKDQSRFFYKKDEKGNCILAGNVFKSDRFILSGRNKNYADAIIGTKVVDGKAEGKINFLYGEGDNGINLSVTTSSDGKSIAHVNYSLNAEQEKAIDDMIESFIRDYIADSVARVSEINGFSKKPSTDDIIDFSINTYLMYNNFNELLEGDTKFYKDAQTFLKRAKEMQGSGVPYGITSFDSNYEPKLSNISSSLDNSEIVINGKKVVMRDGFKAVTILNTIRTSEDSKRLFGTKSKNFEDSELVQNHIITKEVAANLSDLYSGTKINDAQSYITFEEWIRRITARGQLPKYKDLIGRILDESKELNVEDIQEFVQVQKNFYYDLHYDAEFDKFVPRQIKNAEFVLVPRFIKGTELEKVYDLMVKNNIDQLNTAETSKAGKKNVLSIFDENGLVSEENIEDFNKNINKCFEIYSYNNLYTQQEVAQHMDGSNKAGIQIMKKILDNIDPSSPIYKYKKQIIEAYCKNIKESYVKLMEDLGIEIDENGAPKLEKDKNGEYIIEGLKLDKLYKMFYEEAQRTNADSNTLEFFTTDDDGNPMLPPFLSNVSNKIESIIQSVFNNHVTRQLLSGFHAAQVTGVGMSSKIISQNKLSSKSGSKTGNKLQFHPTIKGKIQPYAECLVQMPKEYHNKYVKLLAAGKTKSEAEAEILDLMQKSTADEFIAYRIPTEGKQSISVFKIVGFLDRGQGSTIVVADDWVSQTGSDFDVDSIYTITKSLTVEENGDISVKTDDNVSGRGNQIIDAMISILSDESSFEENLTPSNFKDIIKDRDEMIPESVKRDKKFRSPYNPYDQALYQNDVTSGMTLKGMSVSRDNLCSICNTVKPFISRPITCVYYASDGYTKENIEKYTRNYRSYPITDKDGKVIDTKFVVTHETFGWGIDNRNIKGKILTSYSSQTTAHILDAVKEGNIPNVNQFTFGIYKMFPDLGTDYRTAISFMIQPAITNLINTYNNGNSVFNSEKYDYYNAKREMLKHYSNKLGLFGSNEIFNIKEFYKKFTSSKEIIDICTKFGIDIRVSEEDEITPIYQFNVSLQKERLNYDGIFKDERTRDIYDVIILTQFDDLYYLSKKIGDYVRCSNPDRFGAKVSNYETLKTLKDIYKVSYSGILSKGGVDLLKLIYPDCDSYNKLTENSAPKQYEKLIDSLKLQESKFNTKDIKSGDIDEIFLSEERTDNSHSNDKEEFIVDNNKESEENEYSLDLFKNYTTINTSDYIPANYFLHYSTIISTLVEKSIFETEKYSFKQKINSLSETIGRPLTEDEYKDFKRWYIATKIFRNTNFSMDGIPEHGKNINQNDSLERISGLNKQIAFDFSCKDIMNPTDEEKAEFDKLTPGQKVIWIQQHSVSGGIFDKLNVNLGNILQTSSIATTHRITFNSDNFDIEDALGEMKQAWYSRNYFVKSTVFDLFKYAIVVENFSRKRFGITPLIVNDILIDTGFGENVITELRNDKFNELDAHNYIRSHWRNLKLKSSDRDFFKARDEGHGNCFAFIDNDSIHFAKEVFGVGEDKIIPNYVVIYDSKIDNGESKCYIKIPLLGNTFMLAPINELMPTENSEFSSKEAFNTSASLEYYAKYAAFLIKKQIEGKNFTKVFYEKVDEYKHKGEKLIEHPIFDVNEEAKNPTSGFNKLIADIREGKKVHGNYDFYVFNHALAEKLPSMIGFSAQNYTEQTIDGVTYFLKHEDPKRIKVLGTNFEELCKDAIKECANTYGKNSSDAERKDFADKYLSQHYGNKAISVSKELQELLRKSIEANTPFTNSIFYVMRKVEVDTTDDVDETSMQSSIGEISEETAAQSFVVAMRNDSRNGQEDAFRYLSEFDKEGINIKNDESVKSNVPDILEKTKRYLSKRAEDLIYDANHFYKDEDGNYHRLDDDETIEHIKNNTSEMHRWLRLYFDIKSFGNNYNYVRENGLDTNSENPKNKENLEQIDDIVRNILSQKFLKNAENKFTKLIISQSGDELIANEWFDLTSIGYHNIGGIENLWTDAQEAPIPLMQVILHMATSDVRAKELLMRKRIKEFTDKTDAILKDAMSAGFPINWDHIVDENGNLIRKYTPEFVERYEKFREELKEIANDKNKGQYSVEYLRKRHELDAFLIDNVEREYVRDYYVDLYNLEDTMLNDRTGYPLLYAKYKELSAKRVDILSHAGNGELTDSQKDELDKIQDEIDTLTSTYGREYTFNILGQIMKSRNEWTQEEFEEINASVEAVQALNNYIKGMAVIKDKYFNNNEKEAFKELLEKNLKIIYDMEDPDINGNPRTPQAELQDNKIYKDAVNWVKYNARLVVNPEFKKLLDKAFKELNLVGKGTTGLLSKYAKALHARDLTGAIDGRKFNVVNPNSSNGQTYAQEIKEDVVKNVGANATSAMDSKKLISNNPDEDNIIWKHEFWMALHSNGITNPEYMRITAEINNILIKGWDKVSKTIDMSYFSKQDFEKLAELYDKIRPDYYSKEAVESGQFVKKTINGTNGAGVADFIENNVDFVISPTQQAHYDAQRKKIIEMYGEHSEMFEAWRNVNSFFYEKALPDGSITFVEKPNILLYGTIKPKDAEGSIEVDNNGVPINVSGNERFEYWVDKKKTIANATLRKFTRKVPTTYYWEARREAYTQKPNETEAEAKERYDKWLADNHYFNPSTHSVEPIPCWVSVQYKDSSANRAAVSGKSDLYSYEPRWNQMETEIKDEYRNNSYNKDLGLLGNYIPGNLRVGKQFTSDPVTKYDNNIKRTKYEDDMYSILNDTMRTLCVFDKAKRYIRNGALPAKAKERSHSKAWHIKQMATGLGYWYNLTVNHNDWQNNVGYDNDYQIDMPGLKQLVDSSKGGTVEKLHYPNKSDERFNKNGVFDKAAYDAEYNEIDKKNKDIEKHNQEIHNALLDRDWLTVMKEFMVEAGHYNAVQENKLLLYFGLDYLKNHEVYSKTLGKKRLKYDDKKSLGNTVRYEQESYGEKTLAVYEAFCRRFIFNQFKKDQGNYTKFANLLQQWSSAKYMMLNVTGGIANVLYGETQIAMEAFAKSYFKKKDWYVGKRLWRQSIISFGANLYSDKASELGDGLCKFMNTLEFDKITELHEDNPSSKTKYQRVRNAAYCLQTIGEHFMQNGALLSILASHRIYKAPNGKWVATSEEKYVRNRRLEALKEILGDNYSNFENWIKSFKDDPNVVQDYATRRKDPVTTYVKNYLTSEQQNSFITKQKELETQAREDFKKFPTVYDQFELVNGYAEFKPDSLLADRDKMTEEEAYNILGCIKNKTISVNKKIHGVYDKLGASRLEQEWYGGLIMQYHKHIWPGIMKRWRREGYYNEDRETVEKGSYISLWDFLSIPYSDMKNMPESSKNVMTGIQNYFKAAARFLFNIKTNYRLLPDYEKANIRRCLSEIAMYLSAVCVAIALKMMDDDDEYEESISYNLAVYLADRLSTEIEMYTPRGAVGEGKKLWSQPIAVEGIVLDLLNAMGYTAQMLIQGDEYSPNYKSGPYYGDSKITTLLTRQLPIYRSTSQIWRLPKNNKYYKRQTTLASDMSDIIVKQIKD